jgi:hypothetical protein
LFRPQNKQDSARLDEVTAKTIATAGEIGLPLG